MPVIFTKYCCPTNTSGARLYARATTRQSIRISWDMSGSMTTEQQHARAARVLMNKHGWTGDIVGGQVDGGYVWVIDQKDNRYA